MPTAKRRKGGTAKAPQKAEPPKDVPDERPTPAEVEEEEHPFVQLARKHWLQKRRTAAKVKNDVLKQGLWEPLERDGFQYKPLLLLESLQTLER